MLKNVRIPLDDIIRRDQRIVDKIKSDPDYKDRLFSPSFLEVIQQLDNSKSEYRFDVKRQSGDKIIEKKLDRNDIFIMKELGFFLLAVDSDQFGKAKLQTHPNKSVLGNFSSALSQTVSIETDTDSLGADAIAQTGTVAISNGSAVITGTGTLFTTEFAVGDVVQVDAQSKVVSSITNDTSMTADSVFSSTVAGQVVNKRLNFQNELVAGQLLLIEGTVFQVVAISSIITAQLNNVSPGVTNVQAFELVDDDLNVFWNGKINLKVGSTEHIENLDTQDAYFAPEDQKFTDFDFSSYDGRRDGYIPLDPPIIFRGIDNIDLRLTIPNFSGRVIENTTANIVNYAIVKPKGWLIKEAFN